MSNRRIGFLIQAALAFFFIVGNAVAQNYPTPQFGAVGVGTPAPSAGNINITGQYQVGGSSIGASNLSNGTSGAGSVVLSNGGNLSNPTIAGGSISGVSSLSVSGGINNFYVSTTGSDTNNTCTSFSAPCATITHALNEAMLNAAASGLQVINLGAGTFNESVFVTGSPLASGTANRTQPMIMFNGAGSGATTWNGSSGSCGTLVANYGGEAGIENLTINGTGTGCQSSLYAQIGGHIHVEGGVIFGPANNAQLFTENAGSEIQLWNNYTISGGAAYHAVATTGSYIEWNPTPITVTLTGTPAFSSFFAWADTNASIYVDNATFSGSATGARYKATANGVVNVINTSATYLPGNAAGVTDSGGRYLGQDTYGNILTSFISPGAPMPLTSGTCTNMTSINLPPGTWEVYGDVYDASGSGTTISLLGGAINSSSSVCNVATASLTGSWNSWVGSIALSANNGSLVIAVNPAIMQITTTTTIFLNAQATFSGGAFGVYGRIVAVPVN